MTTSVRPVPAPRRWSPAIALVAGLLGACAPQPDPYYVDRDQAIAENRFLRAIHSPEPEEEPPPDDLEDSDDDVRVTGQRHRGEEGKMGRPTSRTKSGLYAMRGPRDAIPRSAGILGQIGPADAGCRDCGAGDDRYGTTADNPWTAVLAEPLSTFSIDVDTAAYSNVRRFLGDHSLPPRAAVRVEEMINYFDYDFPAPKDGRPLAVHAEVAPCPWDPAHQLVQVGVQGEEIAADQQPPRNLVFLIDVSGSMQSEDRLPLLRRGLERLVDTLGPRDRISMVVYAGASGVVLPPTPGDQHREIRAALAQLEAGGSTNGGAGIALAYAQARQSFLEGGVNRVILASDGDFNVGVTGHDELVALVEQQRRSGVFLSVLGFGRGNLNDHTMEQLADRGDGNYAYIDSLREAEKVLVAEGAGTLVTVARDVKLQVEFNPAKVASYRLVGYENRRLAAQDFNDDRKDAGELGAGHDVVALYEVVPAGKAAGVDPLKYQVPAQGGAELLTVKVRYKPADGGASEALELPVKAAHARVEAASEAFRTAAAVAAFGLRLRDPGAPGLPSFAEIHRLAASATQPDRHGRRAELLELIREAGRLTEPAPVQLAALIDDELG
jgi:Ca-activated chloride channel family protein